MELQAEIAMRQKLEAHLLALAERIERGELSITTDELAQQLNAIAAAHGCTYGLPIPSTTDVQRSMVLAGQVPLANLNNWRTDWERELSSRFVVRNSWQRLGDWEVCVVDTDEGRPMSLRRPFAGVRLRKLLDTALMRHGTPQTAEAEMRALTSLRCRINDSQYTSYVLGGIFPERSPRSDLHYIFRKGYPALAVSYHGESNADGKVIAALCLHPMGYYEGTYCGLMCPTDEVICHLLMMRGDEKKYWANCGQWSTWDTRSGI